MKTVLLTVIAAVIVLSGATSAQQAAEQAPRFPSSTAEAQGLSRESLQKLHERVQALVKDDEIVGAEVMIIKNGRSILHEGYGWRDREAKVPMKTGNVFCVRSMTKPLIGTAILMLADLKLIKLSDKIAAHLPSFAVEGSRDITINQLLTHTSGLPMSLIMGKDLKKLGGIQEVAALGGSERLSFEPGSRFSYSDQGTDTLTALIEVVAKMSAADFITKNILTPLGMSHSTCVMTENHALRRLACSKYVGSRGSWTPFWDPKKAPLFPFFLGSQGLYASLEDYARFLAFWMDDGRRGEKTLLEAGLMKRALTPSPQSLRNDMGSGFQDVTTHYGSMMQIWNRKPAGADEAPVTIGFGHSGSDGTYAWAFPKEKVIALYFTQSRNNTTGPRIEAALDELIFGRTSKEKVAAPSFSPYLGYYYEGEGDLYRAIIRDGEDLALEILGKAIVPLDFLGEDRWKFRPNPRVVLEFQRSKSGEVTGYRIGKHEEFRIKPDPDRPKAKELAAAVAKAHRLDLLKTVSPLRLEGAIEFPKLKMKGTTETVLASPNRFYVREETGDKFESVACDGREVWSETSDRPRKKLEGEVALSARRDQFLVYFGDWRESFSKLEVVQSLTRRDRTIHLVRAGDCSAPAPTFFVDAESGHLVHVDTMVQLPGLGRMGKRINFGDFRDVSGMSLPHKMETKLATPFVGPIITTIEKISVGAKIDPKIFKLSP